MFIAGAANHGIQGDNPLFSNALNFFPFGEMFPASSSATDSALRAIGQDVDTLRSKDTNILKSSRLQLSNGVVNAPLSAQNDYQYERYRNCVYLFRFRFTLSKSIASQKGTLRNLPVLRPLSIPRQGGCLRCRDFTENFGCFNT